MKFLLQMDKPAFSNYTPSLAALERAFRKAGLKISFLAECSPARGKKIHIRKSDKIAWSVSIEGDSPAQAVKDVAAAVRL
jgi:hypothetical protein